MKLSPAQHRALVALDDVEVITTHSAEMAHGPRTVASLISHGLAVSVSAIVNGVPTKAIALTADGVRVSRMIVAARLALGNATPAEQRRVAGVVARRVA